MLEQYLAKYPNIMRVVNSGLVNKLVQPEVLEKLDALLDQENVKSLAALNDLLNAIGQRLSKEQQLFVSLHWKGLQEFLQTEEGAVALQQFVTDWQACKE